MNLLNSKIAPQIIEIINILWKKFNNRDLIEHNLNIIKKVYELYKIKNFWET